MKDAMQMLFGWTAQIALAVVGLVVLAVIGLVSGVLTLSKYIAAATFLRMWFG